MATSKENVDGDTELSIEVLKLLTTIAERVGLRSCKFLKKPSPGKGDGYLGILTRIEVSGRNHINERISLHLIVKAATVSEQMRKNAFIKLAYDRESLMYNTIFPEYMKFQRDRSIQHPFDSFAKCYETSSKDFDECLVLEDLNESGYSMKDCKTPMDEEHISLVFGEYAKLHAVGLALKDQKPDLFKSLAGDWTEIMTKFFESPNCSQVLKLLAEKAIQCLDPIEHADVIDRLQKFANDAQKILIRSCRPGEFARYDTILHGDGWNNNMMFKYCEESKIPKKVCFLDWQIARVSSPVTDLAFFFYTCAGKSSLNNLNYHLNNYYEKLSKCIIELGSNPAVVYPRSVFLSQWQKYCTFGLGLAILNLHLITSDKSEQPDLPTAFENGKSMWDAFFFESKNVKDYHDRIKWVILHHYERNYI